MKIEPYRLFAAVMLGASLAASGTARADIIALHQGNTSPLTEGFSSSTFGSPSTTAALANDQGLSAWNITGTGQSAQFAYASPILTAPQTAAITSQGFTMTLTMRVIQGLAPAYDSTSHVVIGGADFTYNNRRYEIDLGLNASGDTVAVLPTSIDNIGPGSSIRAPGASYTLTGSGSTYHTYQLIYVATTQTADLYIDGVDRIQGYTGHTSFTNPNLGLIWGAFSGGQGNFNLAKLESGTVAAVPEPSPFVLGGVASLLAFAYARLRKGKGKRDR